MPILASPVIGDVQWLDFNVESNLPLEIRFLQFCLVFKSFSITYPKAFFEGRCPLQPCRPCELQCPWALVFKLLFQEMAIRGQDFFKPYSGYWGNLSLRESPLPDWTLEWPVPVQKPQGLCLIPYLPYPSSPDKYQAVQNWLLEGAVFPRWGDSKERGWRWEPHHQEMWRVGDFSSLFLPRGCTILWVSQACLAVGWLPCTWRFWTHGVGTRRYNSCGAALAGTSSPAASAAWQRSLESQASACSRDVRLCWVTGPEPI